MTLPFIVHDAQAHAEHDSVALAVYAPFGTDSVLSTYPDGTSNDLLQHPLIQSLIQVAGRMIHVIALIDRTEDDTYLVEIPAGETASVHVLSRWKQDMTSPNTLAGFLLYVHMQHPTSDIVLALEGHGAGFLPDIDRSKLTIQTLTNNGEYVWKITGSSSAPTLPMGGPVLPMGGPVLPMGGPVLPVNHMPLSTYGLGKALKDAVDAGVPKPAVIHFNNCFNLSVEVLHTIAPYAEYATGYPNYNFFTAGASYPKVFEQLQAAGSASSAQLAEWFSLGNRDVLAAKGNHPTAGGVVKLAAMHEVVEKIDDLADGLLAALRNAPNRAEIVTNIRDAIIEAQQYDTTHGDFSLETPDELTDVRSFAQALKNFDFGPFDGEVHTAADGLLAATAGIKRYGERDRPWLNVGTWWDFRGELAMNIFLPDPLLLGLWDWRSPFYLNVNPDPTKPRVQPNIIDFVKVTDWVDFILEYHKDVPFVGLLPAEIPEFPVFNAKFEPPKRPDKPDQSYPPDQTDQTPA